ncbi:4-hydroxyproline epimerase [Rhabdaerophilum sp. SD176]|uniref:4-hydroxyproline epimerase n=1 Tax=Rhabdaerophilum sp. SD176 TaxID=2983548 RepID=UPI0024DFAC21|nr:4-hydroxyproline epimerase [Rhabdaerophilum sp. SD176]
MARHTFFCVDGHTCGNPVRMVVGGGPDLKGATMSEKRDHFMRDYDWIRTALMFEPRGHDMMSGSILYPPTRPDCDIAILYIETTGCLPMCGHGTIGTVTMALEQGLVKARTPGILRLDTPAGLVEAHYREEGGRVTSVKLINIPSFLFVRDLAIEVEGLGKLVVDISYGGNFYAIIDPQPAFAGVEAVQPSDILRWSPRVRAAVNAAIDLVHPENPAIRGCRHVLWAGKPTVPGATARNAVFYGEKAIDRSPCGTGTSARLAQWAARGRLKPGEDFIHESIIGSLFTGRIEGETRVGEYPAIIPSIEGWAVMTGLNTIFVDDHDPLAHGFVLADRA